MYEHRQRKRGIIVQLTVGGDLKDEIPIGALPDCERCPKPELDPTNYDVLTLWQFVVNQQTFNGFSGERLGLRAEAVTAVLDELCLQGLIEDRGRAFKRIWILDRVVNEIEKAKRPASSTGTDRGD